jgi:phytoene/squalene synthetase
VINHLQDCGKDYRTLDRVYLPLDALERAGAKLEDLKATRASPALRRVIHGLAHKTGDLLEEAKPFAGLIADFRLGLEVTVILRLAESLNRGLMKKDPLSERVHHRKTEMLGLALLTATRFSLSRTTRSTSKPVLEP